MKPDEQNQNNNGNDNSNNNSGTQETPPQDQNQNGDTNSPPPPENNQPAPNQSDPNKLLGMYEQLIRQQNEEIQKLKERTNTPPAPQKTPEERKAEFWNNPSDVIREEIHQMISPLLDMQREFSKDKEINKYMTLLRADPRYSTLLPKLENTVREILKQSTEINEGIARSAFLSAAGLYATGQLPGVESAAPQNNQPPKNNTSVNTPPHFRPSPPPIPENNNKSKVRELNELERRIARERGMTDEEYVALMDAPATFATAKQGGNK